MSIFQKTNVPTQAHKNGHNFTCDQYFFHETCTIGFSTHRAINPCQKLKYPEWSLFSEQVTNALARIDDHYFYMYLISPLTILKSFLSICLRALNPHSPFLVSSLRTFWNPASAPFGSSSLRALELKYSFSMAISSGSVDSPLSSVYSSVTWEE